MVYISGSDEKRRIAENDKEKLCEEIKAKSNIEIDRKTVSLNAPINKIGEYTMLIKLTSKVKTELKVVVTASEVVQESIEEEPETSVEA